MPYPCRTCGSPPVPGDLYCVRCGAPSGPVEYPTPSASRPVPAPAPSRPAPPPADERDETTRYLCAAAQLDTRFADDAIAEYLVEPVRAVPPSPGLDAAAVLREAIAARARRRTRDIVLLSLLGVLCLAKPSWVLLWLLPALAVRAATTGSSVRTAQGKAGALGTAVVLGVVVVFGLPLVRALGFDLDPFASSSSYSSTDSVDTAVTTLGVLILSVLVAVLATDEFTVHHLVHTCFRPHRFRPDATALEPGWERTARTMGQHRESSRELRRIRDADDTGTRDPYQPVQADVVVHRGFVPFVGAGEPVHRQVIALPLDPDEESTTAGRPIAVTHLHAAVADALASLRTRSSLGPDRRLERLTRHEQILVPAEQLVRNLDRPTVPSILPDVEAPPISRMELADARAIAEYPTEWARYYQCFRVEIWDRDLTMSCYLHAGTDQRMLFLEWTFCMLPPLRSTYRHIDRFSDPVLVPLRSTIRELAMLPASVPARVRALRRRFRPIEQRDEEIVPDRYGADRSLREIAAADGPQNYFQLVDVVRYVKILDKAVVRAVGAYLQDNGYSVVEFQRQTVAPTYDMRGSTLLGNTFGQNSPIHGNVQAKAETSQEKG